MSTPPPIPRLHATGVWDQAEHLLLWVRTGAASVRLDGHSDVRLVAGEGVWLPAELGTRWTIVTEPGSVVFPVLTHPGLSAGSSAEPRRFPVTDGWQDWLIQHFNLRITPLDGRGYSDEVLAELLHGSARRPVLGSAPAESLPLPKARGAREVAGELRRDPALDLTVVEWATRVLSSPRTLLRDFRTDTGLTFEQWRLRCRLDAAVHHLAAGAGPDSVAARVGFASRNGFTRAFKQQFGTTPAEFGRSFSTYRATGDLVRETPARPNEHLVAMALGGGAPEAPGLLPATRTVPHANDVHVLCWSYRGSGYLGVGDRRHDWGRGVATWIPAGVEHVTGVDENSICLPLGDATTAELHLAEPLQAQFSPAWDDYLLFCSVSARTPLRPHDHDPARILELFADQVDAQRALSVPLPTAHRAREVALHYLRHLGGSATSEVPADIHRAFRTETGMSLARWQYATRMRIARDLLIAGAKPSAVAGRIGYAHLPTFSAAFTRFHGVSPRDYQGRERG